MRETKRKVIGPIARMTRILNCLLDGPQRLTQISIVTGMNRSTIHKILNTLEATGYVVRDPVCRDYHFGPMFWNILKNLSNMHEGLIICANDEMRKLREETGATTTLFIRSADKRIVLKELLSIQDYIGVSLYSAPIYTGSSGLVLLSQMNDDELTQFLKLIPSELYDKQNILNNINLARRQGYLIASNAFLETGHGLSGLSVPIKNYFVPVALALSDVEAKIEENITYYLPKLIVAGENISAKVTELTS